MTDCEALARAVELTGHSHFRALLDPASPHYKPEYWPVVRRIASRPDNPPDPMQVSPLAAVQSCPDLEVIGCACRRNFRCRGTGQPTTLDACLACLTS